MPHSLGIGSPGFGHVRATTDEERIVGQIERGEVLAGPEAARIIAARHEAEYGDVWDKAWATATADLTESGKDCD